VCVCVCVFVCVCVCVCIYVCVHPPPYPPTPTHCLFTQFAEINNFHCHAILRDLRPVGSKVRKIPQGNLFAFVACANYTWECAAWLFFAIFTQTVTSYIFLLFSFVQILEWSLKKHKQYKEEFADDYKKLRRKSLIPFVI
jgi:very-long-chain enoyl-CoA reductase